VKLLGSEPADSSSGGYLLLAVQVASLLLTGCVIWIAVAASPSPGDTVWIVVVRAFGFAVAAWAWSAVMLGWLYFFFAETIPDHRRHILRTSTAAVWFAPAIILLTESSAASLFAALVLVINTTRILYSDWRLAHSERDPPTPERDPDSLFRSSLLPPVGFARQLLPAIAVALLLQGGGVATLMRYPLPAAGCFAFAAALVTGLGMAAGVLPPERPRDLPRSILGAILTVFLAAGLTVGGSAGALIRGSGAATHGAPDTAQPGVGRGMPAPGGSPVAGYEPAIAGARLGDNDFPGVILWPEIKDVTTLVAPLPARNAFSARGGYPLGIPFSGEYWMFRRPYRRPPYGSFFRRGSPARLGFVTTDRAVLQMEAHHRLEQPVELRCCRSIRVDIWNADRYPGTVALELILVDSGQPASASQRLGTAAVKSSPGEAPVREELEFPVPATRTLERFDELTVVFHRDRTRGHRSARIEIDRFVLVPAG
jgi:hypothetical protein